MKIALSQMNIKWENKEDNQKAAVDAILAAKEKGAKAVFFPEMSLTGFSMDTDLTAESDLETVQAFQRIAQKERVAIGIGWVKRRELAENHYTVLDSDGRILSDYVKIHPFSYGKENIFFQSGSAVVQYNLGGYSWSTFICYDLRFPELFQIASEKAEVIVVPANWPGSRAEHWRVLLRARAIENQCYILGVNCVGNIGGLGYRGDSCVISPYGDILDALENKEGNLIADLNMNVGEIRREFPVKQDRKWDFYRDWYGRKR